jgi:hypothetical protein
VSQQTGAQAQREAYRKLLFAAIDLWAMSQAIVLVVYFALRALSVDSLGRYSLPQRVFFLPDQSVFPLVGLGVLLYPSDGVLQ